MVYSTQWLKKVDWYKSNHTSHFYKQRLQMYERLVIFLKYKNIKIGIKIPIMFRHTCSTSNAITMNSVTYIGHS